MAATLLKPTVETLVQTLEGMANPANVAGMARFGIRPARPLGISMTSLRGLARGLHDHDLAARLWDTGIHEARILATLVDEPRRVTPDQMERWAADFDSWDLCDQTCSNLFSRTAFAHEKILAWTAREEEFVRRAGFVMMANLAVHDKRALDDLFLSFLPVIALRADDGRNFVRKAVNWALRQIGKRNPALRQAAIETAHQIQQTSSPSARWIAADALRELDALRRP